MGTHPIFESDFDCLTDKRRNKTVEMTDQSEVGSVGNYLDIIKEACSITCEPDSHSNWILNEVKHQIKENAKSGDEPELIAYKMEWKGETDEKGINYFLKILLGPDTYHVKAYKPIVRNNESKMVPNMVDVKNAKQDSEIEYF